MRQRPIVTDETRTTLKLESRKAKDHIFGFRNSLDSQLQRTGRAPGCKTHINADAGTIDVIGAPREAVEAAIQPAQAHYQGIRKGDFIRITILEDGETPQEPAMPTNATTVHLTGNDLNTHAPKIRDRLLPYLKAKHPQVRIDVDQDTGALQIHNAEPDAIRTSLDRALQHYTLTGYKCTYTIEAPEGAHTATAPPAPSQTSSDDIWNRTVEEMRAAHEAERQSLLDYIAELKRNQLAAKGSVEPVLRQKEELERRLRNVEARAKAAEDAETNRRTLIKEWTAPVVYDSIRAGAQDLAELDKRILEISNGEGIAGIRRTHEALEGGTAFLLQSLPSVVANLLKDSNVASLTNEQVLATIDDLLPQSSPEADQAYHVARDTLSVLDQIKSGALRLPPQAVEQLNAEEATKVINDYEARKRQGNELTSARNRVQGLEEMAKRVTHIRAMAEQDRIRVPVLFIGSNGSGEYSLRVQFPQMAPGSIIQAELADRIKAATKRTNEKKWKPEEGDGDLVTLVCHPGKGRMRDVSSTATDAITALKDEWEDSVLKQVGVALRIIQFAETTA